MAAKAGCAANPDKRTEPELLIIEFKPGHERWEQPELFSYLASDEQAQLRYLIQEARARRDAAIASGER